MTTWKIREIFVLNEVGQVDVTASLARLQDRPATYRGGVTAPAEIVTSAAGSVTTRAVIEPGNSDAVARDPADVDLDDPSLSTAEAIRRKENFLGLLRRYEYRVTQGDYVRRTEIVAHFSRAFTGFQRQFQMAPARYAPEMAGRLGVDSGTMHGALEEMISTVSTELSAPVERGVKTWSTRRHRGWEPYETSGKLPEGWTISGRLCVNGLVWESITADWTMRKRTTKTGDVVTFDLTALPLALAELQRVKLADRRGAVIVDEVAGRPYAENRYQQEWRKVADEAGIPRDVWNTDARSDGATEADEAGAARSDVQRGRPTATRRQRRGTCAETRSSRADKSRRTGRR